MIISAIDSKEASLTLDPKDDDLESVMDESILSSTERAILVAALSRRVIGLTVEAAAIETDFESVAEGFKDHQAALGILKDGERGFTIDQLEACKQSLENYGSLSKTAEEVKKIKDAEKGGIRIFNGLKAARMAKQIAVFQAKNPDFAPATEAESEQP